MDGNDGASRWLISTDVIIYIILQGGNVTKNHFPVALHDIWVWSGAHRENKKDDKSGM